MIANLPYATLADYSPRGTSDSSKKSRNIMGSIKAAHSSALDSLVTELLNPDAREFFGDFLGPDITLVPTPRSSLLKPGHLWPSLMIAQKLQENGLGKEVFPCLSRIAAVPKSSFQRPGQRPSVQTHYDSLAAEPQQPMPAKITIIDDVLSVGRTVYAGALRLEEVFPNAQIKVFAVLRTRSAVDLQKVKNFTVCEIIKIRDGCYRKDPEARS